jgi:hypothetical protein
LCFGCTASRGGFETRHYRRFSGYNQFCQENRGNPLKAMWLTQPASFIASKKFSYNKIGRVEMKSNHLTNILLLAVLAAILASRLPAIAPTAAQPAAAAPAVPSRYSPQGGMVNGYISIPAAAFHPALSSNIYTNGGCIDRSLHQRLGVVFDNKYSF